MLFELIDFIFLVTCTRPNHTGSDEFALNDDWSTQDESSNFEEEIFRKIDLIHSRVHNLKAKVDSVMTKYAGKFSSSESLSHLIPCDAQTSSIPSPTLSACNGSVGLYASFPHMSDCELEDLVMPDVAISNYGDDILIPDIIESTVGLLSSTDVTEHESQIGDLCEKVRQLNLYAMVFFTMLTVLYVIQMVILFTREIWHFRT